MMCTFGLSAASVSVCPVSVRSSSVTTRLSVLQGPNASVRRGRMYFLLIAVPLIPPVLVNCFVNAGFVGWRISESPEFPLNASVVLGFTMSFISTP